MSGRATPVMKTTKPSKNLPAAASIQMSLCIWVMGVEGRAVPSGQTGSSSMYSCTVRPRFVRGSVTFGIAFSFAVTRVNLVNFGDLDFAARADGCGQRDKVNWLKEGFGTAPLRRDAPEQEVFDGL